MEMRAKVLIEMNSDHGQGCKKSGRLVVKIFINVKKNFRFALKSMEMRAKVLIRLVSLTKLAQIDNGDSTTLKSLP